MEEINEKREGVGVSENTWLLWLKGENPVKLCILFRFMKQKLPSEKLLMIMGTNLKR